jgi:hypothetical protein
LGFLDPDKQDKPHYFLIVDWHIEQGTTVANLVSYLTHNGGRVLLCAHTGDAGAPLVPKNVFSRDDAACSSLQGVFAAAVNNRALPAVGDMLVRSAARGGVTVTRDMALFAVEAVLNGCGNSLTALTHRETVRLMDALQCNQLTYSQLLTVGERPVTTPPVRPAAWPWRGRTGTG